MAIREMKESAEGRLFKMEQNQNRFQNIVDELLQDVVRLKGQNILNKRKRDNCRNRGRRSNNHRRNVNRRNNKWFSFYS